MDSSEKFRGRSQEIFSSLRYCATIQPLNTRWTHDHCQHIILAIWIVASLLSSVHFVYGRATEFVCAGRTYYSCSETWEENSGKAYTAAVFTMTFLTPMLILIFTYASIASKMLRHMSPGNANIQRDQQQLSAKVAKMLVTLVLMFSICCLPIQLLNVFLYFGRDAIAPSSEAGEYLYIATFFTCHWLSMANSFVNPIIYCFMSDNFKADVIQLIRKRNCTRLKWTQSQLKNRTLGSLAVLLMASVRERVIC